MGTDPVPRLVLRDDDGQVHALGTAPWSERATTDDEAVLAGLVGPVLDLGCGPGRLVLSLARRGVTALGVDSSPAAVALARQRGAPVLQRDLFDPLPGEGRWGAVLLFDGNVGIGGDPTRLLGRCRHLVGAGGRVVAELWPPGAGHRRVTAWVERSGCRGPEFPWAILGVDAVERVARRAGLRLARVEETPVGRRFAHLVEA